MRLSAAEARRRFAAARTACLATVDRDGMPHLVPVTFAVDGDLIYTAVDAKPKTTTDLRRLRNIRDQPQVTLLADHYEDDWRRLWWARADGAASIVGTAAGTVGPVRLLAARYPQYRRDPPAGPVIQVAVGHWTGWAASPGGGR